MTKNQLNLLKKLTSDIKVFDKHDNTFKMSTRQIAKKLGMSSHTTIVRFFKMLKDKQLMKEVLDIYNKPALMLSPRFFWEHNKSELHFGFTMYILGSHKAAVEHSKVEVSLNSKVDVETGEMTPIKLKAKEDYLNDYTNDRTRHRNTTGKYIRKSYIPPNELIFSIVNSLQD